MLLEVRKTNTAEDVVASASYYVGIEFGMKCLRMVGGLGEA